MSLLRAMAVLAEQWDDVQRHLDPPQAGTLRQLTARFAAETDLEASVNLAENIMDLLTSVLPDTHPVREALSAPRDRLRDPQGPVADRAWFDLAGPLRRRLQDFPGDTRVAGEAGAPGGGTTGTTFDDANDDDVASGGAGDSDS